MNPSHASGGFRTDLPDNLKVGYDPGMTIVLLGAAVAFAALCVWLTVRIINRRERWAKRTLAAVVVVPVLYVLSIGPARWAMIQEWCPIWVSTAYPRVYSPLRWILFHKGSPQPFRDALNWYVHLWH